jgi:hypothetical protein
MSAPRIVASAKPRRRSSRIRTPLLRLAGYAGQRAGFFSNSQIDGRYLYIDPETFTPDESVDQLNDRFQQAHNHLKASSGHRAVVVAASCARRRTTTTTGWRALSRTRSSRTAPAPSR